jgi:hypothetical protein
MLVLNPAHMWDLFCSFLRESAFSPPSLPPPLCPLSLSHTHTHTHTHTLSLSLSLFAPLCHHNTEGTYQSGSCSGSSNNFRCTACPAGQSSAASTSSAVSNRACISCPQGTYAPNAGQATPCLFPDTGHDTNDVNLGATARAECNDGSYNGASNAAVYGCIPFPAPVPLPWFPSFHRFRSPTALPSALPPFHHRITPGELFHLTYQSTPFMHGRSLRLVAESMMQA